MLKLHIEADHLPYLIVQNGQLDHLALDRQVWERAYNAHLEAEFKQLLPALPERCERLVDIGGGMGGIDLLLERHYGDQLKEVCILDGAEDAPVVRTHDQTFNHFAITESFLTVNGMDPAKIRLVAPDEWPEPTDAPYDLVISLRSWCFHYPPEVYLKQVDLVSKPGTKIIVDLREHRLPWFYALDSRFTKVGKALVVTKKSKRTVWEK